MTDGSSWIDTKSAFTEEIWSQTIQDLPTLASSALFAVGQGGRSVGIVCDIPWLLPKTHWSDLGQVGVLTSQAGKEKEISLTWGAGLWWKTFSLLSHMNNKHIPYLDSVSYLSLSLCIGYSSKRRLFCRLQHKSQSCGCTLLCFVCSARAFCALSFTHASCGTVARNQILFGMTI